MENKLHIQSFLRINGKIIFTVILKIALLIDFITSKASRSKQELEINCVLKFLVLGNSNSYML